MKSCWQQFALFLTPSTLAETSASDADEWRDYCIRGQFKMSCGTEAYIHSYYTGANDWYRIKLDYDNQAVTVQMSDSTASPMITDLVTESRSLVLNAVYPFIFETHLDAKTRIPSVFYDDASGAIGDNWTTVSGTPTYVGGYLDLDAGDEAQAIEDVTGPCIEADDTIMDECGCAAITQPASNQFDMSQYATSFTAENDNAAGAFIYRCHWNYTTGAGVRVTFDLDADTVTIDVIQVGSPAVVATASASFTMADATEYTIWVDAYDGSYTVWYDNAGTPTQIVTLADTTYTTGDFGFGSTTGETTLGEIICVPRDSEDYNCPWLIWMKDVSILQDRDGANGALDGQTIETGEESTNFIRLTMGRTEISAEDRTHSAGSVALETAAATYLYLPVISVSPIRTACRDNVAI